MDGYFNVRSSLSILLPLAAASNKARFFQWNGGWPTHLTKYSPRSKIKLARLNSDERHLHHLGGRTFMAAISPWYSTVRLAKVDETLD